MKHKYSSRGLCLYCHCSQSAIEAFKWDCDKERPKNVRKIQKAMTALNAAETIEQKFKIYQQIYNLK